ncbi:MAG: aminoglycoside phosphotransferase family protein, partial [Clostridiales bacterium]|nr:aminoglycoside phosphotransferase family protein [Clostridiales bacterium]
LAERFRFEGRFASASEVLSGHINRTYRLRFTNPDGEYILQRINAHVFRRPEVVMDNILKVTEHLRRKLVSMGAPPERRVLEFVAAVGGGPLFVDGNGGNWRAYRYVGGARAYDLVEKPEHFQEAGRAFGEFQKLLADFPASELRETIPNFHHTPSRFDAFARSVDEDSVGRAKNVRDEIRFFLDRRETAHEIVGRDLPLRVAHNDTKISNVLFDEESEKAICVIDLDTVMPGSALYDFGDAIRYGATTAAEDEKDASKMGLSMELFSRFAAGFVPEADGFLSRRELELLPLGARVITFENGMRFLMDYLEGDAYYKTAYPEHNLARARTQIALLKDIERRFAEMEEVVRRLIKP